MRFPVRAAGVLAALAAITAPKATGCECRVRNICERVQEVPVIFLGEVIEGGLEPGQNAWEGTASFARLRVVERYKGLPRDAKEVVIQLRFIPGMCAPMPYRKGEQTLVFVARDQEGNLRDGICTESWFAKDRDEDLAYVRRYFGGNTSPTIRGRVAANATADMVDFALDANHGQPVEGARVVVEGGGKRPAATTDSHGRYEIFGVAPGTYLVHPEKEGYVGQGGFEVHVRSRGCAFQNLGLFAQNSVEGSVLDPDGKPVPAISVYLQKVGEKVDEGPNWGKAVNTNALGSYRFERIDPGSYYLVVNPRGPTPFSPFGARFYGGAESRELAAPIEITPTSELRGLNIYMSKPLPTRNIRVVLTWPNGQLVRNVTVECSEVGSKDTEWYRKEDVSPREDGLAICHALAGIAYRIGVRSIGYPPRTLVETREALAPPGLEDVEVNFQFGQKDYELHVKELGSAQRR
jgi:hypothetical protein